MFSCTLLVAVLSSLLSFFFLFNFLHTVLSSSPGPCSTPQDAIATANAMPLPRNCCIAKSISPRYLPPLLPNLIISYSFSSPVNNPRSSSFVLSSAGNCCLSFIPRTKLYTYFSECRNPWWHRAIDQLFFHIL